MNDERWCISVEWSKCWVCLFIILFFNKFETKGMFLFYKFLNKVYVFFLIQHKEEQNVCSWNTDTPSSSKKFQNYTLTFDQLPAKQKWSFICE